MVALAPGLGPMETEITWRCFHCDQVFWDPAAAEQHFGKCETVTPLCKIDGERVRAMEKELAQYRAEDTELHRQIASMESKHAAELRAAEEKGYERGLKDSLK